jgi:acetolactate synthase-1/2/3 large subunit
MTGYPITSTLMGLGAYPASDKQWLGMLGMHGTYEANMAMHDCDVMICLGARFDDRITGRTDAFSPGSKKIHIDIDPSSINKTIKSNIRYRHSSAMSARAGGHGALLAALRRPSPMQAALKSWWAEIESGGRAIRSVSRQQGRDHAAIRDPAAVRADQGPRHLHHHRSGPAPDVGGAVLSVSRSRTAG